MINENVIAKIDEVKDQYEYRDQLDLEKIKEAYEQAGTIVEFRNHFIIDAFCKKLIQNIEESNHKLCEDPNLPEEERSKLFLKKQIYKEFLDIFDGAKTIVHMIEEESKDL